MDKQYWLVGSKMRPTAGALAVCASMFSAGAVHAERIGVAMADMQTPYPTAVAAALTAEAKTSGVDIDIRDVGATEDEMLKQVNDFISTGVDALIIKLKATDTALTITRLAKDANVPVVYINQLPINFDSLPDNQAFAGSEERTAGTMQMQEVCKRLGGKGNVWMLIGNIESNTARRRAEAGFDTIDNPPCTGMEITESGYGDWKQPQSFDIIDALLSKREVPDAIVAANDAMALGAIEALEKHKIPQGQVLVAGVDATQQALQAMQQGKLQVTVLQDAKGQSHTAMTQALAMARGEKVDRAGYVPFTLITSDNMMQYVAGN